MALMQVDNAEFFSLFPCFRAPDFQFSLEFFSHATSASGEQDVKAYISILVEERCEVVQLK